MTKCDRNEKFQNVKTVGEIKVNTSIKILSKSNCVLVNYLKE